ncbi:hypothetical protein B0H66DRAFT_355679 [Apodospora peruviana]|uniref:WHIM1 domain-containing protein n=1 Tax=Apodospora peruviana TaxID=516989 RepID=A0AAE0HVW4_9PEZI|nr:hypothetical protein B0H66DRAFT_355679 [Apodospora peruviana]
MTDDESSELSSISSLSAPPSDDESDIQLEEKHGILKFFHKVDKNPALEPKEPSPPPRKREPSPPHEYVLADNPDIAFIVMFRARFTEAFPKSLANFGPQELERDVVEQIPGERVEAFLCALLGLLLNRKQDVKPGHYNRALEEAIQTHKSQWAKNWESKNPLSGSATFSSMTPVERLTLLRALVEWTLSSSDVVKTMINQGYKNRHEDDLNITLSVQPWGSDGDKRRYFLIEGNDDTAFRVYRESNPAGVQRTWWSVAGTIDELKALSEKLETNDGGPKARALAKRINNSIPRFEATEEKRKRREYRLLRKEAFKRPETGFSVYEGRTRGKRMKYTYSDDEDDFNSDSTNRRSTRNTRNHTPAEPSGLVTTASGRQVRAPTRLNAESASTGAPSAPPSVQDDTYNEDAEMTQDEPVGPTGRPRRSAAVNHGTNGWRSSKKRKSEEYESGEEDDGGSSPDFGDDEEDGDVVLDEEDEEEDEFAEDEVVDDDDDLVDDVAAPKSPAIFKFPIKATIGQDGKAKMVPGPPPAVSGLIKRKYPRAAHRNIVISDESSTPNTPGGGMGRRDEDDDDNEDDEDSVQDEPEEEPPAAESIAVVIKPRPATASVTEASTATITKATNGNGVVAHPGTPIKAASNGGPQQQPPTTAALAFRGSPEKPPAAATAAAALPRPATIDV